MDDNTYLVTGGASGIGALLVESLSKYRGFVYFVDIDEEKGKKLEFLNKNTRYIKCDVTIESEVENVFKTIKNEKGILNCLVNCAAIAFLDQLASKTKIHSSKSFDKILNINLFGTFNFIRKAAFLMINQPKLSNNYDLTLLIFQVF